jgi:hypothetical protein
MIVFALLFVGLFFGKLGHQSGSVDPGLSPFKAGALPEDERTCGTFHHGYYYYCCCCYPNHRHRHRGIAAEGMLSNLVFSSSK